MLQSMSFGIQLIKKPIFYSFDMDLFWLAAPRWQSTVLMLGELKKKITFILFINEKELKHLKGLEISRLHYTQA